MTPTPSCRDVFTAGTSIVVQSNGSVSSTNVVMLCTDFCDLRFDGGTWNDDIKSIQAIHISQCCNLISIIFYRNYKIT